MPLDRRVLSLLQHVLEKDGFFVTPVRHPDVPLVRRAIRSIGRSRGWTIRTETWAEGSTRVVAARRLDMEIPSAWRYEPQVVLKDAWRHASDDETALRKRQAQRRRFANRKRVAESSPAEPYEEPAPVIRLKK